MRRTVLIGFLILWSGLAQAEGLHDIAARSGLVYGCGASQRELLDPQLQGAFLQECGFLTPSLGLKMSEIVTPSDGRDWLRADWLTSFGRRHELQIRGHNLVWWKKVPAFLPGYSWQYIQAWLTNYTFAVARRYPEITSWDVVNEPLAGGYWQEILGEGYLDSSFWGARWACPQCELVLNEWGLENDAGRRAQFLALLKRALARGVPIDAIGLQSHLSGFVSHYAFWAFVRQLKALGLNVIVTEMDVFTADEQRAASILLDYVMLARSAGIKHFTSWGVSRRYTAPDRRGQPLDANMQRTPSWYALAEAFGLQTSSQSVTVFPFCRSWGCR